MSDSGYPPAAATTPTRLRERASYDRAAVHAVLDEGLVCHVGFVVDGRPVVLPHLYARRGEELLLHGSAAARALRLARGEGLPVCVAVTLTDGLVLARSAFHHSINYRSVVVHGTAEVITDPDAKQAALTTLVDAVVPGRSAAVRGPSRKELAATSVLRLPLVEVSLKSRSGPPKDEPEDLDLPTWAGVLPLTGHVPGTAEPAPELDPDGDVPAHVTDWHR